jgi:segregation and condensation protein B
MSLKQIVEALLIASQKPLMPREIVSALKSAAADAHDAGVKTVAKSREAEVGAMLEQLKIEYLETGRAFQLIEQVTGWQIVTSPEFSRWVRALYPESKPVRLSSAALETLAIIAYRQPITRAEVEAVRGVAVDGLVQSLLERGLIRIAGRAEAPGRPLMYETTEYFLEHFGLRTLDELPNSEELRRIELPKPAAAHDLPVEEKTAEMENVQETSSAHP